MDPCRKTSAGQRCRKKSLTLHPAGPSLVLMVAAMAAGAGKEEPFSGANGDNPTAPLERIRVSDDKTHFTGAASGRRMLMWGMNYDHDETMDRGHSTPGHFAQISFDVPCVPRREGDASSMVDLRISSESA